ncbi:hypothetical protein KP509_04G038600 [Ceratopteris richardii]|uniref:RRM domain-containing protein n=1 Tax=Ceratopteris richardii TaxID=49495 RepID=A0A8T2UW58_CERRI|nr:hypothetical protein KP509_04G038600 [Ceratopteris richardii]
MAIDEVGGLTFSLEAGSHGAAALRSTIMKKLSDFMGSYTDDVLAEYVVVLVSHGKQRAQAIKDLEAFLGDQSESFVTWLWEHLASNMNLYTSPSNEPASNYDHGGGQTQDRSECVEEGLLAIKQCKEKGRESLAHAEDGRLISRSKPPESQSKRDSSSTASRSSRLDVSGITRFLSGSTRGAKRQRSPDSSPHSERVVSEKQKASRVGASMRLLQSAVREAVAPSTGHLKRQVLEAVPSRETSASVRTSIAPTTSYSKRSDSAMKRLQSVVSADFEKSEISSLQNSVKEARQPVASRQAKRAMPAFVMAMKAAAAAAEDVTKARSKVTGNIWDRLGDKSRDSVDVSEEDYERYGGESEEILDDRYTSHYESEHNRKKPRLDPEDILSEGSLEEDAVESDTGFDKYVEETASSRNMYAVKGSKHRKKEKIDDDDMSYDDAQKDDDSRSRERRRQSREESVTVEYRLARNMDGVKDTHKQKGSNVASGLTSSSQKIVNISVNVNTWKSDAYDNVGSSEQPISLPAQNQLQEMDSTCTPNAPGGSEHHEENTGLMHISSITQPIRESQQEIINKLSKPIEVTKEVAKPMPSVTSTVGVKQVRKLDDAESRTVFVTNIHFAASKESVMAHFASCGEISRTVMLTDGATGQPKGSAYIEFKTRDAADRALALNDSSFYSRALKVVRKDAAIQAIQGLNPLIHPALIRRPIPLALRLHPGARLLRAPPYLLPRRFTPAIPRPYPSFPSLQWKRDGPASSTTMRPGFNPAVRPVRSNSYVRTSDPQPAKPGEESGAVATPPVEKEEMKMDIGPQKEVADVQMEQG